MGLNKGAIFSQQLEEKHLNYEKGDIFLFSTDGLTEAADTQGEEFGEAALLELLREQRELSASKIRDAILKEVSQFADDNDQRDDQTLVVVKVV